jgi:hypothetical protein
MLLADVNEADREALRERVKLRLEQLAAERARSRRS